MFKEHFIGNAKTGFPVILGILYPVFGTSPVTFGEPGTLPAFTGQLCLGLSENSLLFGVQHVDEQYSEIKSDEKDSTALLNLISSTRHQ